MMERPSVHNTTKSELDEFLANVWNECGMADCNRTIKHTMEEPLLTGKRQVHDFVGHSFEGISFGNELGELGFI